MPFSTVFFLNIFNLYREKMETQVWYMNIQIGVVVANNNKIMAQFRKWNKWTKKKH